MKVPLSWLKRYVPVTISAEELAHRLTMAGVEVGDVVHVGADWDRDKIVVGHVLKVDPHPDADRLTLPTVEVGNGETQTVVCGAPNVAAGQKIAFAREGARLFSPRSGRVEPLRAARIRGVESAGMVCSVLELGLGDDHEGILVLEQDAPTGTPLVDYLGDAVLDVEVTPNRPDCLSMLGVAHEVAAITGGRVTEPDLTYTEDGPPVEDKLSIEIADPELCGRYTASLVTGIRIGPSPHWLRQSLTRAGQRPINNVVDITNFVMLEYGQPLHAFDYEAVKDNTVIVRAARPGEVLVTLDGQRRVLEPPILTIADSEDAVGLAGVMGGANSEMHEGTTSVLLESASFDPVNTRRTAASLRLNTEASYRFERGIRAELAPLALRRATQLILEIAGGEAATGIVDLYPGLRDRAALGISQARLKQVLGVEVGLARTEEILTSLGFQRTTRPEREATIWVNVPYWRSDISMEDDLVEEVARIVGYETIPMTMLSTPIPHHEPQRLRDLRERLKDLLAAAGMQETISYALTSLEALDGVGALAGGPEPLKMANPMSNDLEYLRTSLRGSVLQTLSANRRISQLEGMRLFEAGRVYLPRDGDKLPREREMVVGVLSGPRFETSWMAPESDMGFFDAKGVLEEVFAGIGAEIEYRPSEVRTFHPGRTASLTCDGNDVGVVGEMDPRVLDRFGLDGFPVALFELDVEKLRAAMPDAVRPYRSSSRYPSAVRDLALILEADVPSSRIGAIIDGHRLVYRSTPFDVYSGEGVPAGKRSVAYRVAFQSASATLTSEQVDRALESILGQLRKELGAELRS